MELILYCLPIAFSIIIIAVGAAKVKSCKRKYLEKIEEKTKVEVAQIQVELTNIETEYEKKLSELESAHRSRKAELENEYQMRQATLSHDYETRCRTCNEIITQIEARRKAIQESIDDSKASIERELNSYHQMRKTQIEAEINTETTKKREAALAQDAEFYELQERERNNYRLETDQIKTELDQYRAKRDALNAEIMRQRELEEKQDFYRVVLSEAAKQDIKVLESIREKLNCRENLSKLIYDNYVAAPAKEMVKRVLEGREPCGIYKITRIATGEIYVGKSVNVRDRFISHIKTACGVAAIASSTLHTTMARDGIDQFTFELLEEVDKSRLTEREKYWITFYNSDKYGLNQKVG